MDQGSATPTPDKHGLPERVLSSVVKVLQRHPEVEAALLFGSRAKGNFRPESDIDLALVGQFSAMLLARITFELTELPTPYSFDVLAYGQITNAELLTHIQRVGVTIYGAPHPAGR